MQEDKTPARIIIVGAGGDHFVSLNIMQKLRELGHEAVILADPNEVVRFTQDIHFADMLEPFPLVSARLADVSPLIEHYTERTPPPHGWYQQFAGKRGRPPRY